MFRQTRFGLTRTSAIALVALLGALAVSCGDDGHDGAPTSLVSRTEQTVLPSDAEGYRTVTGDAGASTPPSSPEPAGTLEAEEADVPRAEVALDANADTPVVEAAAMYAAGATFTVAFVVVSAAAPYQAVQFAVSWSADVVAYVSADPVADTGLATCVPAQVYGSDTVAGGCIGLSAEVSYAGPIVRLSFECVGTGSAAIAPVLAHDLAPESKVASAQFTDGFTLDTTGAEVTCG